MRVHPSKQAKSAIPKVLETKPVDGVPKEALITGRVGRWNVNGASSGGHTISLVDPAGCFPDDNVVCP